jgi:hypothetical protein
VLHLRHYFIISGVFLLGPLTPPQYNGVNQEIDKRTFRPHPYFNLEHAVAPLVEVLPYNPEGRGFEGAFGGHYAFLKHCYLLTSRHGITSQTA